MSANMLNRIYQQGRHFLSILSANMVILRTIAMPIIIRRKIVIKIPMRSRASYKTSLSARLDDSIISWKLKGFKFVIMGNKKFQIFNSNPFINSTKIRKIRIKSKNKISVLISPIKLFKHHCDKLHLMMIILKAGRIAQINKKEANMTQRFKKLLNLLILHRMNKLKTIKMQDSRSMNKVKSRKMIVISKKRSIIKQRLTNILIGQILSILDLKRLNKIMRLLVILTKIFYKHNLTKII